MASVWFLLFLIVLLAAGVGAVVTIGIAGAGKLDHPEMAKKFARTAKVLQGEAETPEVFNKLARLTTKRSDQKAA